MSADEIKKYINQIAFSGATEFVEKYKEKVMLNKLLDILDLGFYSAFMVSSYVEIKSKSYINKNKSAIGDVMETQNLKSKSLIKKKEH